MGVPTRSLAPRVPAYRRLRPDGPADQQADAVRSALTVDPTNPEALYEEGIILWQGLHRYAEAEAAFRAYLAAAPFGSHRDEVQGYLDRSVPAGG